MRSLIVKPLVLLLLGLLCLGAFSPPPALAHRRGTHERHRSRQVAPYDLQVSFKVWNGRGYSRQTCWVTVQWFPGRRACGFVAQGQFYKEPCAR